MEKLEKGKKLTLQVGESTHTHVLMSDSDVAYEEDKDAGTVHMVLEGNGVLTHEEHGTMVFHPGNYHKFSQVEYSPFDNDIRQVFD